MAGGAVTEETAKRIADALEQLVALMLRAASESDERPVRPARVILDRGKRVA